MPLKINVEGVPINNVPRVEIILCNIWYASFMLVALSITSEALNKMNVMQMPAKMYQPFLFRLCSFSNPALLRFVSASKLNKIPWINPQAINVSAGPCHSPLRKKVIINAITIPQVLYFLKVKDKGVKT